MGSVMIRCPATGTAIRTGLEADSVSFRSTPVFIAHVHCPVCGREHEWFAKDAWVEEANEPANCEAA